MLSLTAIDITTAPLAMIGCVSKSTLPVLFSSKFISSLEQPSSFKENDEGCPNEDINDIKYKYILKNDDPYNNFQKNFVFIKFPTSKSIIILSNSILPLCRLYLLINNSQNALRRNLFSGTAY